MASLAASEPLPSVAIRPLLPSDLAEADRILRLAFGTFLKLPDPQAFMGDADYVHTRHTYAAAHFGAFDDDETSALLGSVFVTVWGSFAFFGPLTVDPGAQGRGVAQALLRAVEAHLDEQPQVRRRGLFTFADSTLHGHLYGKFGYLPRYLTLIMEKQVPVGDTTTTGEGKDGKVKEEEEKEKDALKVAARISAGAFKGLYSLLSMVAHPDAVYDGARALADAQFDGLDHGENKRACTACTACHVIRVIEYTFNEQESMYSLYSLSCH